MSTENNEKDATVERVVKAMTRYIEGSESNTQNLWFTIHDSNNDNHTVSWFRDREERDAQLRWKNAHAVIDAYNAALVEAGMVIMPKQEP